MKINIVGAGPAGLYFALLMGKFDPTRQIRVFERDPADNTYGWGIVLSRGTLNRLREADGVSYRELIEQSEAWSDVEVIHQDQAIRVGGNDFIAVQRIRFLNILQSRCQELGVELIFDHNVTDLSEVAECDLLVGADGLKSTVREQDRDRFQTQIEERRNHYIWYGTPRLFPSLTMMFRPHPDGLYIAHAYRFSGDLSTFIVECDEPTWRAAGFAGKTEAETAEYLAQVFNKELQGNVLLTNRSLWSKFALVRNAHWHHENIVLLGDALHSVHFSIGSGTKLAVEDAIALADAFADQSDVGNALNAFERRRKPRVNDFQNAALDSLTWLENVRQELELDPLAFTYKLMRRSNRMSHQRLAEQDPEFIARYEAWQLAAEGRAN